MGVAMIFQRGVTLYQSKGTNPNCHAYNKAYKGGGGEKGSRAPHARKPRKLFGPIKPQQNLDPYYYRAVLFTYLLILKRADFRQEVSRAYTYPLLDTDERNMALRIRKVSGTFEKRASEPPWLCPCFSNVKQKLQVCIYLVFPEITL